MGDYPPDKIVVLATGAQGDEFAALMRMGKKTHKYFQVNDRDTVFFLLRLFQETKSLWKN